VTQPHGLTCDEVRDLAPLFVVGALDADEAAAVRDHLAGCTQPHPELLELGEAATALLAAVEPVAPPPALKARVMDAASMDVEGDRPDPARLAPSQADDLGIGRRPDPSAAPPTDLGLERERRRSRLGWLVAVAAVIGVLALGASNLALRRDLDQAQAYQQGVDQALALAGRPGSVAALLAAPDGSATGLAVIGADGTARITMRGLPATSGSQVYTAWSIEGDAPPVAVGDFTVGADGLASASGSAPSAVPGSVVAVTLEQAAGATAPGGPVVASGTTRAPAG
jgi:anti-sigma-K factor RskA